MRREALDSLIGEVASEELVQVIARVLAEAAKDAWHLGDGYGGWVRLVVDAAFERAGLRSEPVRTPGPDSRRSLSRQLRTTVFERDQYRCVSCGGWQGLAVDHIHPLSRGGTDDLDNLQTLCKSCNSRKGARVE